MRACVRVLAFAWILSGFLAPFSRADELSVSDVPLDSVTAHLNDSLILLPLSLSDDALPLVRFDTTAVYPIDLDVLIQLQVARLALTAVQPVSVTYDSSFEFELGSPTDPLAPLLQRRRDPLVLLDDPLSARDASEIDGF